MHVLENSFERNHAIGQKQNPTPTKFSQPTPPPPIYSIAKMDCSDLYHYIGRPLEPVAGLIVAVYRCLSWLPPPVLNNRSISIHRDHQPPASKHPLPLCLCTPYPKHVIMALDSWPSLPRLYCQTCEKPSQVRHFAPSG